MKVKKERKEERRGVKILEEACVVLYSQLCLCILMKILGSVPPLSFLSQISAEVAMTCRRKY